MKKIVQLLVFLCIGSLSFSQKDTISSEVAFDFGLTRNKNVNLWPILVKSKTANEFKLSVFSNLIGYSKNTLDSTKHGHVFPLYYVDSSPVLRDIRLGTTYYPSLYRKTENFKQEFTSYKFFEIAQYLSFLQFTNSKNGFEVENNLFFFIWYNKSVAEQRTSFVTFPLVWYYKKPLSTYFTIAPMYSHGSIRKDSLSDALKYTMVTPFYWKFSKGNATKHIVIPTLFSSKEQFSNTGQLLSSSTMLSPLVWLNRDTTSSKQVVFPLFWHTKSELKSSITLFPVYSRTAERLTKNDSLQVHTMITPLYWRSENEYGKKSLFIPIYRNRLEYTSYDTVLKRQLFPLLFWHVKNKYKTSYFQFPLYYYSKEKDNITSSSSFTIQQMITPLFWRNSDKNHTSITLFPIYHNSSFIKDSVYEKKLMLTPFLWKHASISKGDTLKKIKIFPFYFSTIHNQDKSHFLFPLVYSSKVFTPNYNETSKTDTAITKIVFPIYWRYKDTKSDNTFFLPFYWNTKDEYQHKKMYFPFYSSYQNVRDTLHTKHIRKTYALLFFNSDKTNIYDKLPSEKIVIHKKSVGMFPLYWNFDKEKLTTRKTQDTNDVTFTNTFKTDTTKTLQHSTVLFPVYWNFTSVKQSNNLNKTTVLFPIYWSNESDNRKNLSKTLFPIFHYSYNQTDTTLGITPFYWYHKNKQEESKTLFPFIWSNSTQNFTLQTNKLRRDSIVSISNNLTIFPIWSSKNKTNTHFIDSANANYQFVTKESKRMLLPIYYHYINEDESTVGITPIFWRSKSPNNSSTSLFPILFSKKNWLDTTFVLFPIYWHKHNAHQSTTTIYPIVWTEKNSFSKISISGQRIDSTVTNKAKFNVFPIWLYYKVNKTHYIDSATNNYHYQTFDSKKALFPLFWHSKNELGATLGITPLFWKVKNQRKISTTLFPIYFGRKTKEDTSYVLFPLVWHSKNKDKSSTTLFPIIWSSKSIENHINYQGIRKDSIVTSVRKFSIFPLWSSAITNEFHHVDSLTKHSIYSTKESRKFLFPLYWKSNDYFGTTLGITPIFWKTTSAIGNKVYNRSTTLFPIVFHKTTPFDTTTILFPLYWHTRNQEKSASTLFPFIWSSKSAKNYEILREKGIDSVQRTERKFTFFPFWSSYTANELHHIDSANVRYTYPTHDSRRMLFPIYFGKQTSFDTTKVLFPIYWSSRSKIESSTTLFPIYWSHETKSGHTSKTLFPFYHHSFDGYKSIQAITPFFWSITQNNSKKAFLFPLLDYSSNETINYKNVGLVGVLLRYKKEDDHKKLSILYPLMDYSTSASETNVRIAPLFWYKRSEIGSNYTALLPLFYANSTDQTSYFNLLAGLYSHKRELNTNEVTRRFAWSLISYKKVNNGHAFRIAHSIFRHIETPETVEKGFLGLYSYVKETNGKKSFSCLLKLYQSFELPIENSTEVYKEIKVLWFIRLASNYDYLKAKGLVK